MFPFLLWVIGSVFGKFACTGFTLRIIGCDGVFPQGGLQERSYMRNTSGLAMGDTKGPIFQTHDRDGELNFGCRHYFLQEQQDEIMTHHHRMRESEVPPYAQATVLAGLLEQYDNMVSQSLHIRCGLYLMIINHLLLCGHIFSASQTAMVTCATLAKPFLV